MTRLYVVLVILSAGLSYLPLNTAVSREANEEQPSSVWAAIIPDAFPRYVYTWRMKPDGTYREDGRDALTGSPIQPTLTGRWSREGARMILRQENQPFVFDGVVLGNLYAGTLYFSGRASSRFCAAKGEQAPKRCDPGAGVAIIAVPDGLPGGY